MVRPEPTGIPAAPESSSVGDDLSVPTRRRHRRIDALGKCFAQLGGGWEASVLNLSVGGMLMRVKRELNPGSTYVVKLFLEDQIAVVEGRVTRASEADAERESLVAIQFTSIPSGDAASLSRYVNR